MHLIRNAIDHGIEPPEARAAGKPRPAGVGSRAEQKGNHVVIEVERRRRGASTRTRPRGGARSAGSSPPRAGAELTRRELLNLIFLPGFSTARSVTELSGRGVGLDVVKNNIANLSGIIDVWSERGRGTAFQITLPVTLAIIRALVVGVSGRTYAVPLNSVLEILSVQPAEVRTVERREVISTARADAAPRAAGAAVRARRARAASRHFVVVVGLAQERLGIAVDELVGQQDIVVKPLGAQLHGVRGISGATDLGNRRTVLVLDVGAIIEEVVSGDALATTRGGPRPGRRGAAMYLEFFGLARKPFSKDPDPVPVPVAPARRGARAAVARPRGAGGRGAHRRGRRRGRPPSRARSWTPSPTPAGSASSSTPRSRPRSSSARSRRGSGSRRRRKADVFASLAEHVARLDAEGHFAVVVVDEAQLLAGRAAFDELRLLTNLAADDRALVGLVLVGQPELRDRLRERGGEAFAQRVGVAYHLGAARPRGDGRVPRPPARRWPAAPSRSSRPAAVDAVHRHSGGVPRRVNQLAASALLEGFAREDERYPRTWSRRPPPTARLPGNARSAR